MINNNRWGPWAQKPATIDPATADKEYSVNGKGKCIALDALRMYKKPSTFDGYYGAFRPVWSWKSPP